MNSNPNRACVPVSEQWPHNERHNERHDYFAGQALANATICTGHAVDWQLRVWFGGRGSITRYEIAAKQAMEYADAMLKALDTPTRDN
jgi:hypothetical protein